jgi:hypothetical protein
MTLTESEYKEFLKTHLDLLFYVGQQKNIFPKQTQLKNFLDTAFEIKFKCREALLDDENILDEYIASNFDHLTSEQINILLGFKKKIKSSFVIFKCLTNYAIFIDIKDNKFYAVKALGDTFDQFFDNFPVNISTTLIPFKDKIIYDGFMQSSGVYFGRNMTQTMNDDYKEAKRKKQIVTKIDE